MYAVVSTGGKQYRVEAGSELTVERLAAEPGASVTFDRVLLVGDGDDVTVGTPLVSGASVTATVLAAERGPKLVIFKYKQKAKYRRRTGHRQQLMRVRIDAISADGRTHRAEAKAEPKAAAKREPRAKTASGAKAPAEQAPKRRAAKADAAEAKPAPKRASAKAKAPAKTTKTTKPTTKRAPKRAADDKE